MILEELSNFIEDIKLSFFGKVIDKFLVSDIIATIVMMQSYRMNKFWLLNASSRITK